jgi:hypothetical protein
MNFIKDDHRLIQNGDSLGKWELDGNNIIVTYDHKGHGTVTVAFKDGAITGENIHENGSTYQWVLERIPQPPAYPDVVDLIDKELVEINLLQKTMNQFTIEVVAKDEQKLTPPFVIPAGCVFCPDSPRFQNIVILRPLVVEKLNDPLPLITCCANPERPFGPAQSYMLRKLPEDCPIRQMTVELSYSPCSTADCQRRIWAKARQNPIKAP